MIPAKLAWVNVASLRMDQQLGRPVLIEFWDFCRCNSLRTLPYVRAWHERYADAGLRVISVHAGGYRPSQDPDEIRAAVARLGIEHPVVIDEDFGLWRDYGNEGWPARYLFDGRLRLFSMHYGEGAYAETEAEICELLGESRREPVAPLRPEDEPGAALAPQTADQPGAWSGPYEAGGVWAVLERTAGADEPAGIVRVNGREIAVEHSGAFALVEHDRHSAGELVLEVGDGVVCHAVQFTPGVVG
ncbi:MAG: hypothetical protein QOJ89_1619 [bacterium]|jgi:hypothetical protein